MPGGDCIACTFMFTAWIPWPSPALIAAAREEERRAPSVRPVATVEPPWHIARGATTASAGARQLVLCVEVRHSVARQWSAKSPRLRRYSLSYYTPENSKRTSERARERASARHEENEGSGSGGGRAGGQGADPQSRQRRAIATYPSSRRGQRLCWGWRRARVRFKHRARPASPLYTSRRRTGARATGTCPRWGIIVSAARRGCSHSARPRSAPFPHALHTATTCGSHRNHVHRVKCSSIQLWILHQRHSGAREGEFFFCCSNQNVVDSLPCRNSPVVRGV